MKRDLRDDPLFSELKELFTRVYAPSFGRLADVRDIRVNATGTQIALAGASYDRLEGRPRSRIALFNIANSALTVLNAGDYDDTAPRWAPGSTQLAFLSDRYSAGRFVPVIYDAGGVRAVAFPELSAESLSWSPDGTRLAVCAAQAGTERAGVHGSGIVPDGSTASAQWLPHVETAIPENARRRLIVCSIQDNAATHIVPTPGLTVWEAAWCGNDGIIAVVSENPREAAWFDAYLVYINAVTGECESLYRPEYQIGLPAATPDGRYAAVVEGCCSDRGLVVGDMLIFDRKGDEKHYRVVIEDVDVTFVCARDDHRFTIAGIRGETAAAGDVDARSQEVRVVDSGGALMRVLPMAAPIGTTDYVAVTHKYSEPPTLVQFGTTSPARTLHSFADDGSAYAMQIGGVCERRSWTSADGLEIRGFLARPRSAAPYPLVVLVHGGPTYAYTDAWCFHMPIVPVLVNHGYAVLLPNPRGSSGRGQEFACMVAGDIGGDELDDVLTGADALVREGIVRKDSMTIMGASHGGYLAAWAIANTKRFAAAVSAFPVTDLFSGYFTGTPSESMPAFIQSDPFDTQSAYFTRSPVLCANRVHTPTLIVCGAHDHCTGTTQALELHRALAASGVESELVTYPQEGHGVRDIEAFIDYCTRVLHWIDTHASKPSHAMGDVVNKMH